MTPLKKYLPARQVWERYGVTSMTLHRWLKDKDLHFPPPAKVINNRRYWVAGELEAWERGRLGGRLNQPSAS